MGGHVNGLLCAVEEAGCGVAWGIGVGGIVSLGLYRCNRWLGCALQRPYISQTAVLR